MLVGRSAQVRELRSHFAAGPGPVLVYGEAGVGKTVLIRTALAGGGVREGGVPRDPGVVAVPPAPPGVRRRPRREHVDR
ncbi:ATP-binding protein [Nocardioides sp. TF02-7]|uniref:ATP-binding protein n=1 Tax=Nocardioides sp. TF02-7 TaxID=2917724 RepID=UPI0031F589EA